MIRTLALFLTLALAACGVETAGTAATIAAMKAKEVKQGEEAKEQIVEQLAEANRLAEQRLKDAADGK